MEDRRGSGERRQALAQAALFAAGGADAGQDDRLASQLAGLDEQGECPRKVLLGFNAG
jgi:hypothetical protein